MKFEKGHIYHIYNQGNNRQTLFFNRGNYSFFLNKIKTFIFPYADIIAWCLMSNHFHLMVVVNDVEVELGNSHGVTQSDTVTITQTQIQPQSDTVTITQTQPQPQSNASTKHRSFNDSIGIMLRSYTRAINKQENRTGKLFREQTKAECADCHDGLSPSFISSDGVTEINITQSENQYPQRLFEYIHNNPVKANIVDRAIDYEFSSAMDYASLRNGDLINIDVASKYIDF